MLDWLLLKLIVLVGHCLLHRRVKILVRCLVLLMLSVGKRGRLDHLRMLGCHGLSTLQLHKELLGVAMGASC